MSPELTWERINVIIPLYNDWPALQLLLQQIQSVCPADLVDRLAFLIIDDGSTSFNPPFPVQVGQSFSILRLYRNVGHQKAIALGLAHLASLPELHPTIVMDADGEDKPEHIIKLLRASTERNQQIVFAHRTKRQESLLFRFFYEIYKLAFRLLTGKVITFGNFSFIPPEYLMRLAHVPEIWNNYPGGVIRSRLPYTAIALERGRRLAGESKMNFVGLVLHGLSAVSVLIDTTAVRLVLFCVGMIGLALSSIGAIIILTMITRSGLPGWSNYFVLSGLLIILQTFLIALLLVFMILSYRTQPQFIPARQFQDYVQQVETIYRHQK